MQLTLLVTSLSENRLQSRVFQFTGGVCFIGRVEGDLLLEETLCSRSHAILYEGTNGELTLRDLGSTNGTFILEKKTTLSELAVGDTLTIEKTVKINRRLLGAP